MVVCFSWFERVTITVIVINCITLGSFQPCQDLSVCQGKCQVLKVGGDFYYKQGNIDKVLLL